ncbi:hypothetical protein C8R44DRAFT_891475 [Mycena epipterygia]|nr:hypothetical protein C8R44DRAFT_891475 [Mycena epipterygia]
MASGITGSRAHMRGMNGAIVKEAAPGDFKRSSARTLMRLLFGGLMEPCEKRSGVLSFLSAVFTGLRHELWRRGGRNYVYDQRFSGEDGNTGDGKGMWHRALAWTRYTFLVVVLVPLRIHAILCTPRLLRIACAACRTRSHVPTFRTAFAPPATLREEPRKPSVSGVKRELLAPLVILECPRTGTPTAYEGCIDIDEPSFRKRPRAVPHSKRRQPPSHTGNSVL